MRHTFPVMGQVSEVADELRQKLDGALSTSGTAAEKTSATSALPYEFQLESAHLTAIIKGRRKRDEFFPKQLFADPAWDMLLELYRADICQRRITISNLCACAAVPATTALRWIKTLEEKGLVSREGDRLDARRVFVCLSWQGSDAMKAYFRSTDGGRAS